MSEKVRVLEADYHRNGSVAEGFYVGIIEDEDGTRKLVIDFDQKGYIAVLDLDEAANGNIYMHRDGDREGTGGNAWRGDHYYAAGEAIKKLNEEKLELFIASYMRTKGFTN